MNDICEGRDPNDKAGSSDAACLPGSVGQRAPTDDSRLGRLIEEHDLDGDQVVDRFGQRVRLEPGAERRGRRW
jgi:hypothetical protein